MLAYFGDSELPIATAVKPSSIPAPYQSLLVHHGHMTEALEKFHGTTLTVHPYRVRREGEMYGRRIDLRLAGGGPPVMTGIMIFNLALVSPTVREEILRADVPLGQILIRHRILRRVASDAYLRLNAKDPFVARFELATPSVAYGRIATILCDQQPAVDLLEVVRP
jgi:chorismate-pyruvate lyase